MKALKDALKNFLTDITTTEIAVIEKSENSQKIISYSRLNLDGDSVNFIENKSIEFAEFQHELIKNTFKCKKALWKFITTASR